MLKNIGYFIVFTCLLLLTVSLYFESYQLESVRKVAQIKSSYKMAIKDSREKIIQANAAIRQNKSNLSDNLSANLNNSTKAYIAQIKSTYNLDSLLLFDSSCSLLNLLNENIIVKSFNCPLAKIKQGQLSWINQEHSSLIYYQKIATYHVSEIYILSQININNNWFKQYPNLYKLLENSYLTQTKRPESEYIMGLQGDSIKLYATKFSSFILMPFLRDLQLKKSVQYPLIFIIFLIVLIALVHSFYTRIKTHKEQKKLLNWLATINHISSYNLSADKNNDNYSSPFIKDIYNSIKCILAQRIKQSEQMQLLANESEEYVKTLQEENIKQKQYISAKSLDYSIYKQIKSSVANINLISKDLDKKIKFIENSSKNHVLAYSNSLSQLMQYWSQEIAKKGERKFVRSLFETKSANSKYDNQLVEQVDYIKHYTTKIAQHSITINLQIDNAKTKISNYGNISNFLELLMNQKQKNTTTNLLQIVNDVDEMLFMDQGITDNFTLVYDKTALEQVELDVPYKALIAIVHQMTKSLIYTDLSLANQEVHFKIIVKNSSTCLFITNTTDSRAGALSKGHNKTIDFAKIKSNLTTVDHILQNYPTLNMDKHNSTYGTLSLSLNW